MEESQKKALQLSEELALVKAQLEESKREMEHIKNFTREVTAAERIGMLEKDLERAREDACYSQSQESAGRRVLGRQTEECNRLKDGNAKLTEEKNQQGLELEKLKSQLATSEQEAKEACEFLTDRSAGDGEVSLKDTMVKLSELHQLTQSSMDVVFQALWPKEKLPKDQTTLAQRLQGVREQIKTWKISACREGAREAWAMVQRHFPSLDLGKVARVGPKGPNGKEIKPKINYNNVMPFARISEHDCWLDKLIDGL